MLTVVWKLLKNKLVGQTADIIGFYRTVFHPKAQLVADAKVFYVTTMKVSCSSWPSGLPGSIASEQSDGSTLTFAQAGLLTPTLAQPVPEPRPLEDTARAPVGLPNRSSSCWLNAILQCVMATSVFVREALSWRDISYQVARKHLQKIVADMYNGGAVAPMTATYLRQTLLTPLQGADRSNVHVIWEATAEQTFADITRLPRIPLCEHCREANRVAPVHSVPLLPTSGVAEGVAEFFKGTQCPFCGSSHGADHGTIMRAPRVLVVRRCGLAVPIPTEMQVESVGPSNQSFHTAYRLCGVVVHENQHYTAKVLVNSLVYSCNDMAVACEGEEILACRMVVAFYTKQEVGPGPALNATAESVAPAPKPAAATGCQTSVPKPAAARPSTAFAAEQQAHVPKPAAPAGPTGQVSAPKPGASPGP